MSAPLPGNAASGQGDKVDKLRPDMFKLSATVQTHGSDDESLPRTGEFPKSPNWFNGNFPPAGSKEPKKSADQDDNGSERSLRMKSSRSSEEDNMHIMVSKSFFITDEERGSIMSRGEPYR